MPKVDIETIPPVLGDFITTPPTEINKESIAKINKALEKVAKEEKEARAADKGPKQKYQYVLLVADPEGKVPAGTELVGWTTKIKEEHDAGTILERILKGIRNFNLSKKGKKSPAKTVGDGIEGATRKFFKEEEIQILNKEPVRIIFTDNKLPVEKTHAGN